MKLDYCIDSVLYEDKVQHDLDFQRFKLYIDLNDLYLKCAMKEGDYKLKNNTELMTKVLQKYHTSYYQDLPQKDIERVKNLFKNDFLKKRNTEYALGTLEDFMKHYSASK